MATATGDIAINFAPLADVNPYTNADYTPYIATSRIASGVLYTNWAGTSTGLYLYSGSITPGNVIRAKTEISYANTVFGDSAGPAVANSPGDGYQVRMNGGEVTLQRLAAGVRTQIAIVTGQTYALGDIVELELTVSTGRLEMFLNGGSLGVTTDTTYNTGMQAGIAAEWDNANANGVISFAADGYLSGAQITSAGAEARRGQTNYIVEISGGSAAQGNATVDINGVDCPITTYPGGGTGAVVCTVPSNAALLYSTTATLTYSDDDGTSTPTATVSFLPASTDDYVVSADPIDLTEASIYYGYDGQAPRAGQNITHTVLTSETGKTFDVNADGTWSLSAAVTVNETVDIFVTDTDGALGTTQTFTLIPGGGGAFLGGKILTSNLRSPIRDILRNVLSKHKYN